MGAERSFVGRESCVSCHQTEAKHFAGSHHDKAMDLATETSVVGNFDDATIEHDGITSRMFRDGPKFMVHTEGPTGKMEDFHVKYVFGVEPLQQYMVEFDRTPDMPEDEVGRLQVLRISWDTINEKWFYLRPPDVDDKLAPDDPLHWTGIAQRWQTMCADCHSTNLKKNFSTESQRYHTTFSEIDVSCEACHGPGSLHIQLANSSSLFWDRNHGYGLAKLKGDDPEPQLQTCAPCHSRRGVIDPSFKGGDYYHDHYALELLRPETYHIDGQIKDEVYVYGSFIQSKMYHKNIRCSDCHDPHSLKLKKSGNETCTSCHQHPSGKYDVPLHHHHTPGTPGAACVNCHMPHTTYMAVDARRDHSLRIPRPDLSVELLSSDGIGPPNACSSCHVKDSLKDLSADVQAKLDGKLYQDWLLLAANDPSIAKAIRKVDQWCDDACNKWYGAERKKPEHFASVLHALRTARDKSANKAALRVLDQSNELVPAIAKATILTELSGQFSPRQIATLSEEIASDSSKEPILRTAAMSSLLTASSMMDQDGRSLAATSDLLMEFLEDTSRPIQNEAARLLVVSGLYENTLNDSQRLKVDAILEQLKSSLMTASDRAGAHLNWAMLCERRAKFVEAVQAYEVAIKTEPKTAGARTNLAELLDQLASRSTPERGKQLSAYANKLRSDELPLLANDAQLAPQIPVVQYRYGLALYLNGELEKAREQIKKAIDLSPENGEYRQALDLLNQKIQQQ